MDHYCRRCGDIATKRCSGCQKEWYCGEDCQKKQWALHIFDCNTPQPPNTAYRLALACYEDLIPSDPETRIDYGFNKCRSDDDESRLISLYQGLIKILGVQPSVIHRARVKGRLVNEIRKHYETVPPGNRGLYYPWFLDNLYILEDSTNGFPNPPDTYSVGDLIRFLQDKSGPIIPSVSADFGFSNCKGNEEIVYLMDVYTRYFQTKKTDPMDLHQAAIKGELFRHVSQYITVDPKEIPKMKRLMMNPYPLYKED